MTVVNSQARNACASDFFLCITSNRMIYFYCYCLETKQNYGIFDIYLVSINHSPGP